MPHLDIDLADLIDVHDSQPALELRILPGALDELIEAQLPRVILVDAVEHPLQEPQMTLRQSQTP